MPPHASEMAPGGSWLALSLLLPAGCLGLTEWERRFVGVPDALQAKAHHKRYTSMLHLAGTENGRVLAYETAANLTNFGLDTEIEPATVQLSYPTAIPRLRITAGASAGYDFDLSEAAVEGEPHRRHAWLARLLGPVFWL